MVGFKMERPITLIKGRRNSYGKYGNGKVRKYWILVFTLLRGGEEPLRVPVKSRSTTLRDSALYCADPAQEGGSYGKSENTGIPYLTSPHERAYLDDERRCDMRTKKLFPHKGRAYLEPDARIARLISVAAKMHHIKQDELLADMLLTMLEDEKEALGPFYREVEAALNCGDLARKNIVKKTDRVKNVVDPDLTEKTEFGTIAPETRVEWDDFLKGVA